MVQQIQPSGAAQTSVFLGLPAVIASESMIRLMANIERVARSSATVLITGESGSGKELVARAVHHYSLRCHKPWVDLSCAALPEHLLESELFGYDKGAFSGADSPKPGLFELANLGIIFLDEIGELDPRMQVKLLRVLDGVPYFRLGGVRKVSIDVRVVAATNQDLQRAVTEGKFRSDLYHRLSQITVHVPPLRRRPEDIVPLARYFLAQQDSQMRFSDSAIAFLRAHPWPGNIRELRNVVTKACLLAESDEIQPEGLRDPDGHVWGKIREDALPLAADGPRTISLDRMEQRTILDALAATGGHQQKAADRLGISRRTLSRKLRRYETEGMGAAQ